MSSIALAFAVSWVAGLVSGGISENIAVVILVFTVNLFVVHHWLGRLPITVAAGALVILGGVLALGTQSQGVICETATPAGVIVDYPRVAQTHVTYIVQTPEGCRWRLSADRWPVYERGTTVTITGGEVRTTEAVAKDSPGFAGYLERQNMSGVWSYAQLEPKGSANDFLSGIRARLSNRLGQLFLEPTGSVVKAMLLGDRDGIPIAALTSVRQAGVAHVLAISGLHISLLVGLLLLVVRPAPLSVWQRTALVLALLWLYLLLIGLPASALRAGAFWSIALVTFRLALLSSLPTAVMVTSVIMLTVEPGYIRDVGFQLSFAAVSGIFVSLFLAKPYRERIPIVPWLQTAVLVSTGATLMTWPLVAYHFELISPYALVANLVVVPVVPLILSLTLAAVLVSYLSVPVALIVAWPVHILTSYVLYISELITQVPGAVIEAVSIPIWFLVLYYFGVLVLAGFVLRWQQRSWREIWI